MGCGCTYQGTYRYKLTPAKFRTKRKQQMPVLPSSQMPSQIDLSTLKKTTVNIRETSKIEPAAMGTNQQEEPKNTYKMTASQVPIVTNDLQNAGSRRIDEFNRRTMMDTRYPKGDSPEKSIVSKTIVKRTDSLDLPMVPQPQQIRLESTNQLFRIPRNTGMPPPLPAGIQAKSLPQLIAPLDQTAPNQHHRLTMAELNSGSRVVQQS